MLKNLFPIVILFSFFTFNLSAQNIFVSLTGDDSNPGTIDQPLKSIPAAISKIQRGDTIYVRGGIYYLTSTISISKSGYENSKYYLFSYPGERPVLDFFSQSQGPKGISLKADFWHIKGFDIRGAGDNGMQISAGSFNTIEFCIFYENRDTGLQLDNGASNNKVINCDSYYNADPSDYGDADGFAPKLTVGTGNYFYGCRAWENCDDGWDGYMRGATDVTTTLENCWTFKNGYLKDGTDPGSQANGNGFKMGGGDNSNSQHLMHHFILKNCLAFENKAKGFDQNNNDGSMTLYNCTGLNNKTADYRIQRQVNPGQTVTVVNCVSLNGKAEFGTFVVQQTNSWQSPFVVTQDDFVSIDTTGIRGPRKEDGSLPDIKFMQLASGSDLIDAGTNVGLTFNESAPDLGAFEFDITSSVYDQNVILPNEFTLFQNYPNPFNPVTTIEYYIPKEAKVSLEVFDLLGSKVSTIVNEIKTAGSYAVKFDSSKLSSGIYVYRLLFNGMTLSRKMIVIK